MSAMGVVVADHHKPSTVHVLHVCLLTHLVTREQNDAKGTQSHISNSCPSALSGM
jgi:hypothetical protein